MGRSQGRRPFKWADLAEGERSAQRPTKGAHQGNGRAELCEKVEGLLNCIVQSVAVSHYL